MMPAVMPVCPKCDVALLILRFKEIEVDFCDRCRGLWLDAGEIERLLEQTGASADDVVLRALNHPAHARHGQHLCPRCDKRLDSVAVADVTLDRCPRGHGIWFDDGELNQVLSLCGAHQTVGYLNEIFGQAPKS